MGYLSEQDCYTAYKNVKNLLTQYDKFAFEYDNIDSEIDILADSFNIILVMMGKRKSACMLAYYNYNNNNIYADEEVENVRLQLRYALYEICIDLNLLHVNIIIYDDIIHLCHKDVVGLVKELCPNHDIIDFPFVTSRDSIELPKEKGECIVRLEVTCSEGNGILTHFNMLCNNKNMDTIQDILYDYRKVAVILETYVILSVIF